MIIEYANKSLEKKLSSWNMLKKHYGSRSRKIVVRMSELRAATSLEAITHLPPPRRHKLSGDHSGKWGIDISTNFRLLIEPIGEYDSCDLTTITAIRITGIEDYH